MCVCVVPGMGVMGVMSTVLRRVTVAVLLVVLIVVAHACCLQTNRSELTTAAAG